MNWSTLFHNEVFVAMCWSDWRSCLGRLGEVKMVFACCETVWCDAGIPEVRMTGVKTDIDVRTVLIGDNKYRCMYVPQVPGRPSARATRSTHLHILIK